jgi:hypothetical protein
MKGDNAVDNWKLVYKNMYPLFEKNKISFHRAGVGSAPFVPAVGSIVSDLPQAMEYVNGRGNACFFCHQQTNASNDVPGIPRTWHDDYERWHNCVLQVNRANDNIHVSPKTATETLAEYEYRKRKAALSNSEAAERYYGIWSTYNCFLCGIDGTYKADEQHCVYPHMCIEMMHNMWVNTYSNFLRMFLSMLSPLGKTSLKNIYTEMRATYSNTHDDDDNNYVNPFVHRGLPYTNSVFDGKRAKASHRYAISKMIEVAIDQLLTLHERWYQRYQQIVDNESHSSAHLATCIFVCRHSAKGKWKTGTELPSQFFSTVEHRRSLQHLFYSLHELIYLADSKSQHHDDIQSIERMLAEVKRTLRRDLAPMKGSETSDPLSTPSAHIVFAHLTRFFEIFGPLRLRAVDPLEALQGDAREQGALTNRLDEGERAFKVVQGSLIRSCTAAWMNGGPIIPHTREYLRLTPPERHFLHVKLLTSNQYVTAGPKLQRFLSDPHWTAISRVISPFFSHLKQLDSRDDIGWDRAAHELYKLPNGRTVQREYRDVFVKLGSLIISTLTHYDVTLSELWPLIQNVDNVDLDSKIHVMKSFNHIHLSSCIRYPAFIKYKSSIDHHVHLGYLFLIFRTFTQTSYTDHFLSQEMIPVSPLEPECASIQVKPDTYSCFVINRILCMSHVMRPSPEIYRYNRRGDYNIVLPTYHRDDIRCLWEK